MKTEVSQTEVINIQICCLLLMNCIVSCTYKGLSSLSLSKTLVLVFFFHFVAFKSKRVHLLIIRTTVNTKHALKYFFKVVKYLNLVLSLYSLENVTTVASAKYLKASLLS